MAETVRVLIETELGEIEAEIEVERAPVTAGNFLRYVDAGFFEGGIWHRTVVPDNQPDNDNWHTDVTFVDRWLEHVEAMKEGTEKLERISQQLALAMLNPVVEHNGR